MKQYSTEELKAEIRRRELLEDPCKTCDGMSQALCDQLNMGECPEKKSYRKRIDELQNK